MLRGGQISLRSERHDCPLGLMPLIESAIAAPDSGLANRDGDEDFDPSPLNHDAVPAGFETRNLADVRRQTLTHAGSLRKATRQWASGCEKLTFVNLPNINSPLFVSLERANGAGNDAPRFSAPTFNEARVP
jgi:hypothetical protein